MYFLSDSNLRPIKDKVRLRYDCNFDFQAEASKTALAATRANPEWCTKKSLNSLNLSSLGAFLFSAIIASFYEILRKKSALDGFGNLLFEPSTGFDLLQASKKELRVP